VHGNVNSVLKDMLKLGFLIVFIYSKEKELELVSSLNILDYIEFDVPSNLNCLKKRLSQQSDFECFARCIFLCV
jgi:hypothetical protein